MDVINKHKRRSISRLGNATGTLSRMIRTSARGAKASNARGASTPIVSSSVDTIRKRSSLHHKACHSGPGLLKHLVEPVTDLWNRLDIVVALGILPQRFSQQKNVL